jgi:hypothetical protein
VVGAERLLFDRDRALEKRLGLGVAALVLIKQGEVVKVSADVRVAGAERFFIDRQCALVERFDIT